VFAAHAGNHWVLNRDPGFGQDLITDRRGWRWQTQRSSIKLSGILRNSCLNESRPPMTTKPILRRGCRRRQRGHRGIRQSWSPVSHIKRSLRKADTNPFFLPPTAGMATPFVRMTDDQFASYTNYRYRPEMLSAGLLPPKMRNAILDFQRSHSGEVAETIRFEDHLDDRPYVNDAWSVIEADQLKHYLLGFYGHLAYHQTPGTFTAYEQVRIKGDSVREYSADYCVRAETVMPPMLKWMLAWEPWDKQELWLARTVPQKWFDSGFSASRVPTRWGPVNFSVAPGDTGLTAQIELASPHPELRVYFRLRPASTGAGPKIIVSGTTNWKWDADLDAAKLGVSGDPVTITMGN
jgi:hypothetical protein